MTGLLSLPQYVYSPRTRNLNGANDQQPFALTINALFIVSASFGDGKHLWDVPNPDHTLTIVRHIDFGVQFIMCTGVTLIKLSALSFYARVFRRTGRLRIALWIMAAVTITYTVIAIILYFVQCRTMSRMNVANDSKCLTVSSAEIPCSVLDLTTDIVILILPLPVLARLQLPLRRRLELCVIFVLGCR